MEVKTYKSMKKFQFVLFILSLAIVSCAGDPAPTSSVKADKIDKVVATYTDNGTTIVDSSPESTEVETAEAKPEIIEFYVEEDKKERKPKASSTKTASATTQKSSSKKKKKSSKGGAKMQFTNDTFAFGTIKPGEVIEHKFEFTNTGTTDLVITDAKATCGCTQPSFPFIPIPPGEKGFIGVKYDSTGKLGTQKPTVSLTTNASPKTQKVYLEGLVIGKMAN